jgi:hypothetical protein
MKVKAYLNGLFWKDIDLPMDIIQKGYLSFFSSDLPKESKSPYVECGNFVCREITFRLEAIPAYRSSPYRRMDRHLNVEDREFITDGDIEYIYRADCNDFHVYVNREGELRYRELDIEERERRVEEKEKELEDMEKGIFQRIKDNCNKERRNGTYAFIDLGD